MTTVLFDIDGTLVQTGGAGKFAIEKACRNLYGFELPETVSFLGRTDRGIAGEIFAHAGLPNDDRQWESFRAAYLSLLPEQLEACEGRVLDGVPAILGELSDRSFSTGLLTGNTRAGAKAKLGYYGIFHYFAFGGFGDLHPRRNDVAREALDAARGAASEAFSADVWVVGDTPLDVQCARAIGARVVAVATGGCDADELSACEPDELLNDLADVDRFLAIVS